MRTTQRLSSKRAKAVAASGAMLVALTGLSACSDSAGPEAEVTTEDLAELQDQVGALEERVVAVEENAGVAQEQPEVVGEQVTVSAQVTEVITSTDVGSAFRISGNSGPAVAVLAESPPEGLEVDDVVQITGTVQVVNRESFDQDFGIAQDELFEDPDAFFAEDEGQPALSATEIELLEQAGE